MPQQGFAIVERGFCLGFCESGYTEIGHVVYIGLQVGGVAIAHNIPGRIHFKAILNNLGRCFFLFSSSF